MTERVDYSNLSPASASGGSLVQRHAVLRNTYGLLALSMVPTVLGAWLGVQMGLTKSMGMGLSLIVFLGGSFAFMWGIERNKHSGVGVALLLAFTFFMGVMLSRLLGVVLAKADGASLVMMAFGITAAVFAGMASLATVIKRDLSGMGKFMAVGALLLFVALLANLFFQSTALMLTLSVIGAGLFSAYILYDIKRIIDGGETNYVSATLALYLDVFNVFQFVLSLLGFSSNND
jgi:modulator of FtsH protease